jgi:hypothetical protein
MLWDRVLAESNAAGALYMPPAPSGVFGGPSASAASSALMPLQALLIPCRPRLLGGLHLFAQGVLSTCLACVCLCVCVGCSCALQPSCRSGDGQQQGRGRAAKQQCTPSTQRLLALRHGPAALLGCVLCRMCSHISHVHGVFSSGWLSRLCGPCVLHVSRACGVCISDPAVVGRVLGGVSFLMLQPTVQV